MLSQTAPTVLTLTYYSLSCNLMKKNTFKLSIVKKDSSFEHRKSDADSKQKLDKKWLVLASLDV